MWHQIRRARVVCAILALTLLAGVFAWAAPLPEGARVVFLGDSITEQMQYTRYVMDYFALRYPDLKVSFRNAGWSGDTAAGGLKRLERDVLGLHPTVVTICFGMNDGGYRAFEQARYDGYMQAMTGLVERLKESGVRVVLLTPGVVDEDIANRGYNPTLSRYAQGVKELAAREHVAVADINTLMGDVQARAKHDDPKFTMIPDSVHPNAPGHALMAYGLLTALGAGEPAPRVRVDAAHRRASAEGAVVQDLVVTPERVTFTRTDRAFPTYFEPEASAIFPYAPVQQALNGYLFQITGLQAGNWTLVVEGQNVGRFSAEELAQGVELGARPGPWQKVGARVDRSVYTQEHIYQTLWKQIEVGLEVPKEAAPEKLALVRKLNHLVASEENARGALTTPRPWKWRLTRAQ